ncbi:hypothetical protein ANMWB30_24090 [Arthrobacter sp. MWB30]|nr:hypothetical protein ANMWB30_24090 [Arthrobacter sp. MWB30]
MMTVHSTSATSTAAAPALLFEVNGRYPAPPTSELYPRGMKSANPGLLAQYITTWIRNFGPMDHRDGGDFEHFIENMARFDAATRAFGYRNTTVALNPTKHMSATYNFIDGSPVLPAEQTEPDFVFGPLASWGDGHNASCGPADRYWGIPAFDELSGRKWILAGFHPDDQNEMDLPAALQTMFDEGIRNFVVKGTTPKSLLEKFTLTVRPTSLHGRDCEIPAEILGSSMHREGDSAVFLVQEQIPMTHEYRFFMAGNKPVSGAGCIEHYTPLDHEVTAGPFDPRTEEVRGSGVITDDAAMVERLRQFAVDAGAMLHSQAPELGAAWVLDVAINSETDSIVVIELNPARNAGLYASSPLAWMTGVRDHLSR